MAQILIIHGPNLNLLGKREPDIYGHTSLNEVNSQLETLAKQHQHELTSLQSNAEADLINAIQQAKTDGVEFIIINPAALTHTSVALRDAFLAVSIPFIEIHISNVYARESFRHHSYLTDIAVGVISGLGIHGYELALHAAIKQLNQS